MMDRRTRFEYGASSFEATISSPPWNPADETVGGMRVAAGGLPASYVVRRDALALVTLRIWEEEWAEVLALIEYGQGAQSFLWYPDADEPANYLVYLDTPKPGERFGPQRDGSFPRTFSVDLVLRGAGSVVPWQPYFDD